MSKDRKTGKWYVTTTEIIIGCLFVGVVFILAIQGFDLGDTGYGKILETIGAALISAAIIEIILNKYHMEKDTVELFKGLLTNGMINFTECDEDIQKKVVVSLRKAITQTEEENSSIVNTIIDIIKINRYYEKYKLDYVIDELNDNNVAITVTADLILYTNGQDDFEINVDARTDVEKNSVELTEFKINGDIIELNPDKNASNGVKYKHELGKKFNKYIISYIIKQKILFNEKHDYQFVRNFDPKINKNVLISIKYSETIPEKIWKNHILSYQERIRDPVKASLENGRILKYEKDCLYEGNCVIFRIKRK